MGLPILPADLRAARAIWLLEVAWGPRMYRWASSMPGGAPVVITDADGVDIEYRGGLNIDWESRFSLFSESSAPQVISLPLRFDAVDNVPQLVADGHDLSAMTATLYRWVPGTAHSARLGYFFGIAYKPNYGGLNEPVVVSFESPIYRDGAKWPDGRLEAGQIDVDSDLATGAPYPLVFGNPAYAASPDSGAVGSPAYPFDRSGKKLLAGMVLGTNSSATLWSVSRDATETLTSQAYENDSEGRAVYVLTSSDASFDADDSYGIQWSGDDIGGGELLAECARASTLRVDNSRMEVTRARLNQYKFSGYIDASVRPFQWFQRNILPLLPASVYHTGEGLAVRIWDDLATADDAKAALSVGNGLVRVGPVQYENSEVLNEISIRFAPNGKNKYQKTRTVTGRAGQGAAPEVILSPYAMASRSRLMSLDAAGPNQGVRSKVIRTPYVRDSATALRIAMWQIRARGSARRVVTYRDTQGHYEWLEDAEHVTITDTEIALNDQLAMVRSRRWRGGDFFISFVLIDDILAR